MAGRQSKPRRGRTKTPPIVDAEAEEVPDEPRPSGSETGPSAAEPAEPSSETASPAAEPERSEVEPDRVAETEMADRGSPETVEAEAPPPRRAPAGRPGSLYRIAAGLGLVALLVAAAVGGWLYGRSTVSPGAAPDERLEVVVERLDRIAADIEAEAARVQATERAVEQIATAVSNLETAVEAARSAAERGAAGQQIADLRAAIDELTSRIAQSGQRTQLVDLTRRISNIEQMLAGLRSEIVTEAQRADTASTIGNAYAALADKIAQGGPYAAELDQLTSLMPTAPGLEALRAHAETGVATVPALEERLAEIAANLQEVPQPVPGEAAQEGVWPTIRERLEGLVTVRRLDEPNWQAAIAEARQALQDGNLGAAISAIEEAPDAPPPELQAWLEQARARREVEEAREQLSASVLRHVAGQG